MTDQIPVPTQLNGWKDIAAFFGKSTRTVQRWEAKLHLPVHRLKSESGDIVYAFPHELEAWRAERTRLGHDPNAADDGSADAEDLASDTGDHGPAGASAAMGAPQPWTARWMRGPRLLATATVVVALAVAAYAAWSRLSPVAVADAAFTGASITARDTTGKAVWTYPVGFRITPYDGVRNRRSRNASTAPIVKDIDGDGYAEVVAVVGRPTGPSTAPTQEVVCLSNTGRLLWRYQLDVLLTFGGRTFGPPWVVSDIAIAGSGRTRTVWVSFVHSVWWPSLLVRIDPAGTATVALVNSGAIYALSVLPTERGSRVLAAGVNNEWKAAMLTVINDAGPARVSPQSFGGPFACATCQGSAPSPYILLLPTEYCLNDSAMPQYNWVNEILIDGSSRQVPVIESEQWNMITFYSFSPDSNTVQSFFDGGRRRERAPATRSHRRAGPCISRLPAAQGGQGAVRGWHRRVEDGDDSGALTRPAQAGRNEWGCPVFVVGAGFSRPKGTARQCSSSMGAGLRVRAAVAAFVAFFGRARDASFFQRCSPPMTRSACVGSRRMLKSRPSCVRA